MWETETCSPWPSAPSLFPSPGGVWLPQLARYTRGRAPPEGRWAGLPSAAHAGVWRGREENEAAAAAPVALLCAVNGASGSREQAVRAGGGRGYRGPRLRQAFRAPTERRVWAGLLLSRAPQPCALSKCQARPLRLALPAAPHGLPPPSSCPRAPPEVRHQLLSGQVLRDSMGRQSQG